jgi:hypothetical protein
VAIQKKITSRTIVNVFSDYLADFLLISEPNVGMVQTKEEVFMEGPLEPNMGPSLADVLLCTFESTNAGVSSFPLRKLLSWE